MLKKAIIPILLSNLLYSDINYVDLYRQGGIQEVEKILNNELKNVNYWKQSLKNKNLSNGYYETLKYVLVCNKNINDINVYETNTNKLIYKSTVISGENKGDKKTEGDLKTPIGAYKLIKKLDNLDSFYGPFALATNYPNKYDKSMGKTGHGIWIHGVPFNEKRDPYTKGCIALENENLMLLKNNINLKDSILIISENKKQNTHLNDISLILSQIYKWRDAWKYGNFNEYISFYSKEFKRSNGGNFNSFRKYKKIIFSRNEKKKIILKNINIIPYPNEQNKNMFKVSMDEDYKTKNYKFVGKKELYVELINNKMRILFE